MTVLVKEQHMEEDVLEVYPDAEFRYEFTASSDEEAQLLFRHWRLQDRLERQQREMADYVRWVNAMLILGALACLGMVVLSSVGVFK